MGDYPLEEVHRTPHQRMTLSPIEILAFPSSLAMGNRRKASTPKPVRGLPSHPIAAGATDLACSKLTRTYSPELNTIPHPGRYHGLE